MIFTHQNVIAEGGWNKNIGGGKSLIILLAEGRLLANLEY